MEPLNKNNINNEIVKNTDNKVNKSSQELSALQLKKYYYALGLMGALIPVVVGFFVYFLPQYFTWLNENIDNAVMALFAIGIVYFILVTLNEFLKKNALFVLAIYAYVLFFLYVIYITGGTNSSFIFTLFFPIISTSVFLDRIYTRIMGMVITIAFAFMIVFTPSASIDSALIAKHIIETFLIGVISYFVYSLIIEIMYHKYRNEETAKKLAETVQIDSLKGDFLSVAQHQLRTPLSAVKWTLEMIKSSQSLPQETISLIDAGMDRIKGAIEVVNQMLKTAEDTENSVKIYIEKVDIVGIIQSIIAELNFLIIKKSVKVSFIAPSSFLINADREKMRPALANIIDNAIKYSPKGHVTITVEEIPSFVRITVRDTGIGIASGDLPYVFYRLHRSKNAISIEPNESGIGLYISKKIIELHGGTIFLSSELNVGTTVTVELPK